MKIVFLFFVSVITSYAASQIETVAAVIIGEAGGEGIAGMQAVASVIQNRAIRGRTPYSVVTRPWQFSCLNGVNHDKFVANAKRHPRWGAALILAEEIENRKVIDATGGATHYHAKRILPYWAASLTRTKEIGNHIFYR